jgi:integrase
VTRRGNGEGSIGQLKTGRWLARTQFDGHRKAYYGKTRAEVAQKLASAIKALRDGIPVPSDRQTFSQFVDRWIVTVTPSLRPKTASNDAQLLVSHAVPLIGRIPLTRLQASDLVRVYEPRRRAGAAPRSILHLHRAIYRCLRHAERWGDVVRNVAALVDAPKVTRTETRAITADEARHLLQTVQDDRLEAFLVLALSTGMRSGELLGLAWRAVDFDRGSIRVLASLQPSPTGLRLMEVKTNRSRRVIDIEPRVVAVLRRHRASQQLERRVAGVEWQESDLVFTTSTGAPIDGRDLIRKWFRPLLKRAGLPPIRIHDLRHSYASIALARGVHPKLLPCCPESSARGGKGDGRGALWIVSGANRRPHRAGSRVARPSARPPDTETGLDHRL